MSHLLPVPRCLSLPAMLLLAAVGLHAQATTSPPTAPAAGASRQGAPAANALAPVAPQAPEEAMTAYPVPPEAFNVAREDIPHGELKVVEYDSKTLGIRRPLRVYTPPGYSADRKYPVLYLQHGLGQYQHRMDATGARADHRRQPAGGRKNAADDHRLPQRECDRDAGRRKAG